MDEIPIKIEVNNEIKLDIDDIFLEEKPLHEEIEKDIPDFINVNNFAGDVPVEERKEIHRCRYCKKKYVRPEYVQIHEYIHNAQKHCPICEFTFRAKKTFIVHINGHVKEKMEDERRSLFCDFCQKPFKKRRALTLHLRVHTNERPYKCHICEKTFKQKGSLTDHNITHTNIKAFPCEICSGSFTTASSLKRHIRRIHDAGKTYVCKICSQKLDNYSCLQQHRAELHPEASEHRQCPICPMVFKSMYAYKKHKGEHEKKGEFVDESLLPKTKYRCILCGVKFIDSKLYVQHKEEHLHYNKEDFQKAQKNGLFSCKLCQRGFRHKQSLFKHMSYHMDKTEKCNICEEFFSYYSFSSHKRRNHSPLKCKICEELVEGKGMLIRHYRITHPDLRSRDRKYLCHICNKTYKSKFPLEVHLQICHGNSDNLADNNKTHKCNVCGREFKTRAVLNVHMTKVHPTGATFKCDSCNILFQNHTKLLKHNGLYHQTAIKRRNKNKSYICTFCNQEISTLPLLRHHWKTKHKVAKPSAQFQCKICLKYFKNAKSRTVHLENMVCTKFFEKTKKHLYKCTICQREFAFRNLVKAHMVVHSKFYKTCRFCNITFTRTHNLSLHIQNAHPSEKVYYCGFCDMEFIDLLQLKVHRYSPAHKTMIECKAEIVEENGEKNGVSEEEVIKKEDEIKKEPVD